ncbi:Imm1 family immunity protein [Myxococcus virescens]|uniref:Imm1 family immunity protein n=1 Tax=Myxococcus virescens TaxID=83456 RepID=UPI003DA27643
MTKMAMIHGDRWEGVLNLEWRVDRASSADLERALEQLDARIHTLVTIQHEGEQHLTIGGGAGQYVVYATINNEQFWNLLRSQPAIGTIRLNAGGQEGNYPAEQIVTKEQALAAGQAFLDAGRLDSSQKWQKQ